MSELYTYKQLTASLPVHKHLPSTAAFSKVIDKAFDAAIILDDDPTGTQTVYDIPVLTAWTIEAISKELESGSKLFYILTNSRSLTSDQAEKIGLKIAQNIKTAADALNKKTLVISRSDSTLRGHYPLEIDLLIDTFQPKRAIHFIIPAFFEGGRYTIEDVHFVKEGENMIPVAETPFAQDKVFGYQSSNLIEWCKEKFNKQIQDVSIHSLSLNELRSSSDQALITKLNSFSSGDVCIVNAAGYDDLKKALFTILSSDIDPLFRSAASLVAALAQQKSKFVNSKELKLDKTRGGVIVLGSYVPKSSSQLQHVFDHLDLEKIKVDVHQLLEGNAPSPREIATQIDQLVVAGKHTIVYTSRTLISTTSAAKNLDIGSTVSTYLTDIVLAMEETPRYIVGKGGITSSDLATKSLQIQRAIVAGQMIPGVPVWKTQSESKFPGVPFIIYPGNVGDESGLTQVINILNA